MKAPTLIQTALSLITLWTSLPSAFCAGADALKVPSSSKEIAPSPVLTNAAQILALSSDQAKGGPSVKIRGMITFHDPNVGMFIQDETAGVFVYLNGDRPTFTTGQDVEVTGVANRGRYSSIVDAPHVRLLEKGPSLTPRTVSLAEIYLGGLDAQWITVTAVVRSHRAIGGGLRLELAAPPHRIPVWIPKCNEGLLPQLDGALVTIRGVVGTVSTEQRLVGFEIFADSIGDLRIQRPPTAVHEQAGLPIAVRDLKNPALRTDSIGRVRTQGVVTLCWPGRLLFIQDPTGGLEIQDVVGSDHFVAGNSVEAIGFLGPVLDPPLLEDAVVQKLGKDQWLRPLSVLPEDLLQGRHDLELVEFEAIFVEWANSLSNSPALVLQSQGHLLMALLDLPNRNGVFPGLEPGSRVQVTGVCRSGKGVPGGDSLVFLLLRSPQDIKVIAAAATAPGVMRYFMPVLAVFIAGSALVAAWRYGQKKRRQTEHVLQLQATLQGEMRQGEQQLRRSMEERDRIGRDLHDDIIQSIYAVGLNLEDCRRVIRESPQQAEARVASAIFTLNNTIRSVRGFLSGLEPKVLNGREFKTALKSLALTSGDGPPPFHIEVDPSAANSLTSVQATQLLHIAKEAMSNSLRHAQASSITVSLHPVGAGVRLEVHDNGAGFNVESIDGMGHGLRNMTARAREIGADLQIRSVLGEGCRILVTVPQRNPNESD